MCGRPLLRAPVTDRAVIESKPCPRKQASRRRHGRRSPMMTTPSQVRSSRMIGDPYVITPTRSVMRCRKCSTRRLQVRRPGCIQYQIGTENRAEIRGKPSKSALSHELTYSTTAGRRAPRFYPSEPARLTRKLDSLLRHGNPGPKDSRRQACLVPLPGTYFGPGGRSGLQPHGNSCSCDSGWARGIIRSGASFAILFRWRVARRPLEWRQSITPSHEKIHARVPVLREDGRRTIPSSLRVQLPFLKRLGKALISHCDWPGQ